MRDFVTLRGELKVGATGCLAMGTCARVWGVMVFSSKVEVLTFFGWVSCARGVALRGDSG